MMLGLLNAVRPLTPVAHADAATTDGEFVPLWTAPLLETKTGIGTPGGAVQKVPANGTMTVQALGQGGLPASGVSAASLKIHAVTPTSTGFLSVYPSDKPTTISTVSFATGESSTNADFTQITATGQITVANSSGQPVDVLIAVDGYFKSGGAATTVYKPLTTAVLWDTRAEFATGSPAVNTPLPAWSSTEVQVAGQTGIPTQCDQSAAVALNIVALNQTNDGELKVEPTDAPIGVGTLQFTANDWNNSTFSIVQMSCSGKLRVTNSSPGTVNVSISVRGYFTYWDADDRGARYKPTEPATILDTAAGIGTGGSAAPMNGESHLTFDATGPSGVPVNTVSAVAMQIKVINPTAGGWITFRPEDQPEIPISSMVYQQGENASGFETQIPSGLGRIAITNHGAGSIHVQIIVRGFYVHKTVEVIEGEIVSSGDRPFRDAAAIDAADSNAETNTDLAPTSYDPVTGTVLTTATTQGGLTAASAPLVVPTAPTQDEGVGDGSIEPVDAVEEGPEEAAEVELPPAPTQTVTVIPHPILAPNSSLSLDEIKREIIESDSTQLPGASAITGAYLQPEKNRVIVETNDASPELLGALDSLYGPSKVAVLDESEMGPIETVNCSPDRRLCMNSPIKGGARYHTYKENNKVSGCTTGFSYLKGKDYFVLSAGHCWGNSWASYGMNTSGYYEGRTCCWSGLKTTTDILKMQPTLGAKMEGKIYRSTWNQDGGYWGNVDRKAWVLKVGLRNLITKGDKQDQVCTGGSYSGELCGWKITNKGDYKLANNSIIRNAYQAKKRGWCAREGDSGGPVYTATSAGVTAWGTIVARQQPIGGDNYTGSFEPSCVVYFNSMQAIYTALGGGGVIGPQAKIVS